MLEKSMYDSWASRIRLFIKGKKHGRMMLDSIDNDYCDVQATNIILHGLPPDVYALVNHQEAAKSQATNERHLIIIPRTMIMQQVQVNTKFLNALPSEWSKFVTNVKVAKSLYTTNYDQLYTYLSQLERHANEVHIMGERYLDPLALQGEYLIECINKAMAFLSVVASRFPPSNNQLKTSSNPRNQATIQDGRVTVQQFQGRQSQSFAGTRNRGIATTSRENYAVGQPIVMKCYNCQREWHMVRQCIQPKRPRNATWFKEKLMLAEAQEAEAPVAQQTIHQNSAFQTEDLDTYDSDCDDLSLAKAVLMANLLSCDLDVLSEDTNSSAPNDLLVLSLVEQMTDHVAHLDKENRTNKMVNESLTAELERYKERVAIFEQRLNVDLNKREKLIDSQMDDLIRNRNAKLSAFQQEINTLKETLSNHVKEKESLSKTLTVFKTESKEKESKYIDKEIVLEKQNKELENIIYKMYRSTQVMHMLMKPQVFYDDTHKQALGYQNLFHLKKTQRIQPTLYDGSVIAKEHVVISVIDDEETLILEEKSRSKMLDKQNDPISIEKKIKISPIDYSKLNKIKEDFGKKFVTQKELSAEQDFWLKHSSLSETPVTSHTPIRIEAPSELPMAPVDQCSIDKNVFEIQIKQLRIDNDKLLNQIMSQEIVHIVSNSVDNLHVKKSFVNNCNKCLELETELLKKKDFIEKEAYDKLVKSYSNLEKHCISLELATQLNQEIFQRENSGENVNAHIFNQLFETNELKAQSPEKDTVIRNLKDRIKSLSGKDNVKNVKKDIDKIETINIKLEHRLKNELRKLKGKNVVNIVVSKPNATIALGIFKLDIEPISPRLKNNRDVHEELLVYVSQTCPSSLKPNGKLVAVTLMNKDKIVRFAKPVTSSSNIPKQNDSLKTKDSNKPLLTSSKTYY
ncbi:hypothetical protein Tco_1548327 [Tanacetum coccineum]